MVGRVYGVERSPDERNPHLPKRITFLLDPDGVVAKVCEVSDAGAHPDEVVADLTGLVGAP